MPHLREPFQRLKDEFPDIIDTACQNGFGRGWYNIVHDLCRAIQALNETRDDQSKIQVLQVKEKLGLLRFYTNSNDNDLKKLIDKAVEATSVTCESCGKPGKKREESYWIKVRCDDCYRWESKR